MEKGEEEVEAEVAEEDEVEEEVEEEEEAAAAEANTGLPSWKALCLMMKNKRTISARDCVRERKKHERQQSKFLYTYIKKTNIKRRTTSNDDDT